MKIRFKIFSAFIAGITALTSITGGVYHAADDTFMNVSAADENVRGDANDDGRLNVRDAACIARMMSRGSTDQLPKTADFNGDGKVNVRDAAAIANTMSMKTCLTDTVFYDVNDDGKDDMIEIYDFRNNFYNNSITMRVYYTDGPLEDYQSGMGASAISLHHIIYDKNINKTYIVYAGQSGNTYHSAFYICNEELNIDIHCVYSYNDGLQAEYSINGTTVSKSEFLNYIKNIEVLYAPYDYNLIESGIKMVETNWN